MFRDLLARAGVYSASLIVGRLAAFLFLPVYTRYLTPADYGILELLDLLTTVSGLLMGVYLGQGLFYYYFKAQSQEEKTRWVNAAFVDAVPVLAGEPPRVRFGAGLVVVERRPEVVRALEMRNSPEHSHALLESGSEDQQHMGFHGPKLKPPAPVGKRGSNPGEAGLLVERIVPDELHDVPRVAEAKRGERVRGAVVQCDAARRRVAQASHREADSGHKARELVGRLRHEERLAGARNDLPGPLGVEQHPPYRVHVAVAGRGDAVVEEKPSLARLDRRRAGADLGPLPPRPAAADHVAVPAPVYQVGALAREDVAERRVAGVRGPAEHQELPADPAREEHAVAVVGKEGVLQLLKADEIGGRGDADGRPVIAIAPGDIVHAVYRRDAGIVGVFKPANLGVVALQIDGLGIEREPESVRAAAHVQVGDAVHPLRAEHADESALPRHDRAVVDARHPRQRAPADDGIGVIAPDQIRIARRLWLPRNVRQRGTDNL